MDDVNSNGRQGFLSCILFENTFEQNEKYCFYLQSMIYGSVQYTA